MNRSPWKIPACVILASLALAPRPAQAQDIVGKVIAGYQGWFSVKGDGSPVGSLTKREGNYHGNFECYPDMREFPDSEQFANPNKWGPLPNGNPSKTFASDRDFTIKRHVGWMKQYGIDVAAIQRFGDVYSDITYKYQKNDVTTKMMRACEKTGVKFYIEYDASGSGGGGWGPDWVASIEKDWTNFAVGQRIAASPAYARQNGKPVVELWGMGLDGNNISKDPQQWLALVRWFQSHGYYVIGGVPTGWNGQGGFHDMLPGFDDVYLACNAINPWAVGRFSGADGADRYAASNLKPEAAWCKQHGIDYIPCVYPGTSFFNSNGKTKNIIPRVGGTLMWAQFANLRSLGLKTCFVSMFDEYNEATQIAKSAEDPSFTPTDHWFLWLDADGISLSSDFYLRLTHDGANMIKGRTPLTRTLPTKPWNDLLATSFESGQPAASSPDAAYNKSPRNIADAQCAVTSDKAQSGSASLAYSGTASGGAATYCYYKVFDVTNSPKTITPNTLLYYWIYPEQDNGRYAGVDILFTDGTTLRTSKCVDQNGHPLRPSAGHGGEIPLGAWSVVTSRLGSLAGKKIRKVWVAFDRPGAKGEYRGYIDDIRISN
ncbi:glycoside hydrolase family 71/99-like protein [Capsulimonas corticalis]|nr:glycoside hydrolase family 71/99-like protein [Capsulimonas corticalis]